MRVSLMVLMLNMFFVGWSMARDDMLWMWINGICALAGALTLMAHLEPRKA